MNYCDHPNMKDTIRVDYCPDCGYEYYYGNARGKTEEERISKLINAGKDRKANNEYIDSYYDEENYY